MKILVVCKQCQAQYDVSQRKPGESLRCRCGAVIAVPAPVLHDGRHVRCASCGAARGSGGDNCEYCGARFSSADKGWGSMCPACFCRLPNDANFCVECGLKINPEKIEFGGTSSLCPRCKVPLQERTVEKLPMLECASCAGLWLPVQLFETICRDRETMGVAMRGLNSGRRRRKFELGENEKVKYIPCPVCTSLMNRRNFGRVSGVIIDTCRDHGVWMDNNELNRIIQFIQAGGLERTREMEARETQQAAKMRADLPLDCIPRPGGSRQGGSLESMMGSILGRVAVEIGKALFR